MSILNPNGKICGYCLKDLVKRESESTEAFELRSTCNRTCSALLREDRKNNKKRSGQVANKNFGHIFTPTTKQASQEIQENFK